MSDEPITRSERYLAEIAARTGVRDAFLVDLVQLADSNVSTSLGLLLDGHFVFGNLASPTKAASDVDKAKRRLADITRGFPPDDLTKEEFDERLEAFASDASTRLAKRDELLDETWDEAAEYTSDAGFAFDEAPAELSQRVILALQRDFLTLSDVQIMAPGQVGLVRLPVLRVAIAHIAAWWIIHLDADGHANFPLFSNQPDQ